MGGGKQAAAAKRKRDAAAPVAAAGDAAADDAHSADVVRCLLEWYDLHHRDLPWRRNPYSRKGEPRVGAGAPDAAAAADGDADADAEDQRFAYAVWVSETMLQQTQVARVREYFGRWMARWPTLESLATTATEEDVNEMWAGLGYYRRGRLLLQGAKLVCSSEEFAGSIPREPAALRSIPGIGEYTAAAIASIAFRAPVAAMDTNLTRVISRLKGVGLRAGAGAAGSAADGGAAMMRCCEEAARRPGCLNQAMMELGARVCQARSADCAACPVGGLCRARAAELAAREAFGGPGAYAGMTVLDVPPHKEKKQRKEEFYTSAVIVILDPKTKPFISGRSRVLLTRRAGAEPPESPSPSPAGGGGASAGLLAGMWEFPSSRAGGAGAADSKAAVVASIAEHLEGAYGIRLRRDGDGSPSSSGGVSGADADGGGAHLRVVSVRELGALKHTFTHRTWHVKAHLIVVDDVGDHASQASSSSDVDWVRCAALKPASYTSLVRKIWKLAQK